MSLGTLTLPCAGHLAVNPSTSQADLDSAGMREQRETLEVLYRLRPSHRELICPVVPVTGENGDLESKKKSR